MKWFAFPLACLTLTSLAAQTPDYSRFYDWFHQRAQAAALCTGQSELLIFNEGTKVMSQPSEKSAVLALLPMNSTVTNLAYPDGFIPQSSRKGYSDIWHKVKGKTAEGKPFTGFVWGGDIAKGWRKTDLDGDGALEIVTLGLSPSPRAELTDIRAELRVIKQGKLLARKEIKGLCLFKDCDTSPLLRILTDPAHPEVRFFEASTLFEGCETGMERAFFLWDGREIQLIYHAEFLTKTVFQKGKAVIKAEGSELPLRTCRFSHINASFEPVWIWEELALPVAAQGGPIARAK
ncbi:MAG: hypothetical protein KBC60_03850 [Haliscomenobacter sp.]|nr:hypothetical protein [Haliscomenobacter sp.]